MPHPLRPLTAAIVTALLAAGCATAARGSASPAASPAGSGTAAATAQASPATTATDPPASAALLQIAQVFNDEYDNGDFGAVYDRWDARSQALISRAEYIRRHRLCAPATHVVATVETAVPAAGGAWHVSYRIGGSTLVDTWFYQRHRWVFDITLSNPGAARNYHLPFARYAAAVGCRVG